MGDVFAPDVDRLPWLTDEHSPKKSGGRWWLAGLALLAVAAIAAVSFWFGMNRTLAPTETSQPRPEVPTALPLPAPVEPVVPEVEPLPMPPVEPAPLQPPVVIRQQEDVPPAISSSPPARRTARKPAPVRAKRARPSAATAKAEPEKKALQFSNPWESAGASGRMVRVGTYSSLRQGKVAWSRLAKAFPAMQKLPAVVTDIPSLRNGRVYYRLQIGTTSQAHSEVLCQRMRAIGQSCVVVDVAGARRGSWDERQPVGL